MISAFSGAGLRGNHRRRGPAATESSAAGNAILVRGEQMRRAATTASEIC
jgi:hypothetical protein